MTDKDESTLRVHPTTDRSFWKAHRAKRKRQFRKIMDDAKSVSCADCGVSYPPYVMDFDHVYGEKLFNIAAAIKHTQNIEKLEAEIAKCEVVCANCHRERTHG